jgi:site-specific DNA-cytosine methylase
VLELFAGGGGTHQGFKNSGFTNTVKLVEHDKNAVETLTTNNSAILPIWVTHMCSSSDTRNPRQGMS